VGSIGGDLAALDKALRRLTSRGQPLHIVYEAGPCGFVIWRHLNAQGLACEVVAPSSIPKRSGDDDPRRAPRPEPHQSQAGCAARCGRRLNRLNSIFLAQTLMTKML
jgi:hypothetical protein